MLEEHLILTGRRLQEKGFWVERLEWVNRAWLRFSGIRAMMEEAAALCILEKAGKQLRFLQMKDCYQHMGYLQIILHFHNTY